MGLKWPRHDRTIHLHLVPSLTMSVALPLLPLDTFTIVRLTLTRHLRLGLSNDGLVHFSFPPDLAEFLSYIIFPTPSPWCFDPIPGHGLPGRGFTITLRHTALGMTLLEEWSVRRRYLYLTTNNTHKRQTSMPSAGFEPQSQQASGHKFTPYTARPVGSAHVLFLLIRLPEQY
jgi:hypothetical protein